MRQLAIPLLLALLAVAQPAAAQPAGDRFCIVNESTILLQIQVSGNSNDGRSFSTRIMLSNNATYCAPLRNLESVTYLMLYQEGREWPAFWSNTCRRSDFRISGGLTVRIHGHDNCRLSRPG
jgi:hypothetical protein